jgi:hypothetical protein
MEVRTSYFQLLSLHNICCVDEFESEFSDDCTSSASVNSNKDLDTRLDDFEIEDISHKKTEITFVSTETPGTLVFVNHLPS